MAQLLILTGPITLLLFIVLTIKVCIYTFGPARVPKSKSDRSRYLRLMYKVRRAYLYAWWIALIGIGGIVFLLGLLGSPTPTLRETIAGVLVGTMVIIVIGLARAELLLGRANLVRGGRESPSFRSLSENSGPV